LDKEGIIVFAQGIDGSRRQILRNFRTTPRSVLLGTRSFWEGIDVVGEALSCLVIARLPFSVPTDPILAARAETFENPFEEYYLPEAILRFRQGFGRLIRSQEDFGIVAVLDKRLITKSYGKLILRSLPPCTARQGPLQSLPDVARRWLDPALRRLARGN
ncbi:MAG: DNA polymerase III subunit epsilon, partial [Chloroflexi bacterium]|nr:DNA polymerase III subunit epsilon [Chloroflexota bacterium]